MASIASQVAQLQRETSPGTAETDAMMRPLSLKLTPGMTGTGGNGFRSAGAAVTTAYELGDLWSAWTVEGVQDFNAIGLIASCVFGPPVTTPVDGATGAYKHVFTPKSFGADELVAYTAQYGDDDVAFQAAMLVFQTLGITVERGNLSLSSSAISRLFDENATLADTGVTDIPAVLIPSNGYNVFADDTWAALGTNKMLACYRAELTTPDKYTPDAPINSAIDGFETLVANAEGDFTSNWSFGVNATAKAMISSFKNRAKKFIRLAVDGPIITGATRHSLQYDTCTQLTNVGTITTAPGSSTQVIPFDGQLIYDDVSGKFAELTITNTVASY